MIEKATSETTNAYNEFMYINNQWELIGSSEVDLTNYVQTTDLATIATSGDYNDLINKPSSEVMIITFTGENDNKTGICCGSCVRSGYVRQSGCRHHAEGECLRRT